MLRGNNLATLQVSCAIFCGQIPTRISLDGARTTEVYRLLLDLILSIDSYKSMILTWCVAHIK